MSISSTSQSIIKTSTNYGLFLKEFREYKVNWLVYRYVLLSNCLFHIPVLVLSILAVHGVIATYGEACWKLGIAGAVWSSAGVLGILMMIKLAIESHLNFKKIKRELALSVFKRNVSENLPLPNLPIELNLMIFKYLEKKDLGSTASVCKTWNLFSRQADLWKDWIPEIEDQWIAQEIKRDPYTFFCQLHKARTKKETILLLIGKVTGGNHMRVNFAKFYINQ